jgi:hypothetical protein
VKDDTNGHERTQRETATTKDRWANQLLRARSATGSFIPIPSNERMQAALLHSPIEITNELNWYNFGAVAREQSD